MAEQQINLVDTSAWIEAFRPGARGPWVEELRRMVTDRQAGIQPIIRVELLAGAWSDAEYEKLSTVLDALPHLDMTADVWRAAESLGFKLRRHGVNVPVTDILIAASAMVRKCALIHRDHHFPLIARHAPLNAREITGSAGRKA